MWNRIIRRRTEALQSVFADHFVDVKSLYAYQFNVLCNISFIGELDTTAAYRFIAESCNNEILSAYQHIYFDHRAADFYFNNTIFVLRNKRMIELGNNYCQVLHRPGYNGWARELIRSLSEFRIVREVPAIGFAWEMTEN